jgi:hypothetical protein
MVKLRLSTRGNNPAMVAKLEAEFDMLKQQVADVMQLHISGYLILKRKQKDLTLN